MQKNDKTIFVTGSLGTRSYEKKWFPNDGVSRVGVIIVNLEQDGLWNTPFLS